MFKINVKKILTMSSTSSPCSSQLFSCFAVFSVFTHSLMADFKALSVRHYPKGTEHIGPEALYWKKYAKQVLAQQIGPVTCVDFSPEEPHQYAVTSSTRVCF